MAKKTAGMFFEAGTSWGYLTLEAERRDLHTHAMAGFSVERVREAFDIDEDITIITVIALGYYGKKEDLSAELQVKEKPALRKPTNEILHLRGKMHRKRSLIE